MQKSKSNIAIGNVCDFCHNDRKRTVAIVTETMDSGIKIDLCGECFDLVLSARKRLGIPDGALFPTPPNGRSLLDPFERPERFH